MDHRPAVPSYLGQRFDDAPPGHHFRLYFDGWQSSWEPVKEKLEIFKGFRGLCDSGMRVLTALRERQAALAETDSSLLVVDARTVAPFATGLGNEHPMENGFSFLDPYGLPYLAGSGVKGVLRRAAEELACFESDSRGWDPVKVWWLFGFDASAAVWGPRKDKSPAAREECALWRTGLIEGLRRAGPESLAAFSRATLGDNAPAAGDTAAWVQELAGKGAVRNRIALRGALVFWDALPACENKDAFLRTELMNPHYSDYYQRGEQPGDWGKPTPIPFLALPAGTPFRFIIGCQPTGALPESLHTGWRPLVLAALEHAFDWLGFGGKTALGFGLMKKDAKAQEARARERDAAAKKRREAAEAAAAAARKAAREAMSPIDRAIDELGEFSGQALESRLADLFNHDLDKAVGEDQLRLGQAIADAYKKLGKWDEGKAAPKQKAKIARLKQLGAK